MKVKHFKSQLKEFTNKADSKNTNYKMASKIKKKKRIK